MKNLLIKIYIKKIRPWLSPLLYSVIKNTVYINRKFPDKWSKIKNYDRYKFEKEIDKKYRWDFKFGVIDFSLQEPDFFFIKNRKYFRDCDDMARMWYWWAKENGYKAWEVCLWKGFKRAHFVTIFQDEEEYVLCSYGLSGRFKNSKEAAESVESYDNWLIYKGV